MRALVLSDYLSYNAYYPDPQATGNRVRVRVLKAGICNTDFELIRGYHGFQGVLGHEFVGITDAGQRVAGEINLACGHCETCHRGIPTQCPHRTTLGINRHDGAFADFLTLPPENLHPIPDHVTDDQAVFVEPLAAGLQTLHQTHISPHMRVVLIGAGKLGLLTAQVIALTGCDLTVICRHPRQVALCEKWGIHSAATAAPRCADVVVDCTGTAEGFADALEMVKPRGVIHLKSTYHDLPRANLTRAVVDEIRIETSRCGPFPAAIRLLAKGLIDVESLIEARYQLADGLRAIEHGKQKGMLKVILEVG